MTRQEQISKGLGKLTAHSPEADEVIDNFQALMYEAGKLPEADQARLLSQMMVQISGKLAEIHR